MDPVQVSIADFWEGVTPRGEKQEAQLRAMKAQVSGSHLPVSQLKSNLSKVTEIGLSLARENQTLEKENGVLRNQVHVYEPLLAEYQNSKRTTDAYVEHLQQYIAKLSEENQSLRKALLEQSQQQT
mmetsp:Transcript_13739/g.39081  ORF Transcript_13739/g.39081 Transcript_13739/m.39081 type:complete len:126 (+) Transcript_13739:54-431(+)|eukprot:CAMPEP_0119134240 /NCGR_PEP_ID=MMETSP1310-20130426/16090_1 /TAXON_ID=464262 /ORGANISM="Genus nov. species nov., Strain RCC2339" /LENGTH=125 /DNA_ID=CAMNT_0007125007 /DNA_START=85 /DNA_END=462 /DNA_ORIENTATION=+